jgi:hypothetical protein
MGCLAGYLKTDTYDPWGKGTILHPDLKSCP